MKDNIYHFKGVKASTLQEAERVYKAYGDYSFLWNGLKLDDSTGMADYQGKFEVVLDSYSEDLDGDGATERVSLVDNGGIELRVNDTAVTVIKDTDWSTTPHTASQSPKLKVVASRNGKSKKLVVSQIWAANKIGSAANLGVYEYVKDKNSGKFVIRKIDIPGLKLIPSYMGNGAVKVSVPGLGTVEDLRIDESGYKKYSQEDLNFKIERLFKDKENFGNFIDTGFGIKDYDGDGSEELMTETLVRLNFLNLYFARLYTVYRFEDKGVVPVKAFIVNDQLKGDIIDAEMYAGSISVDEKGVINGIVQLAETREKMFKVLDEMIKAEQLVRKNGAYYLNLD